MTGWRVTVRWSLADININLWRVREMTKTRVLHGIVATLMMLAAGFVVGEMTAPEPAEASGLCTYTQCFVGSSTGCVADIAPQNCENTKYFCRTETCEEEPE